MFTMFDRYLILMASLALPRMSGCLQIYLLPSQLPQYFPFAWSWIFRLSVPIVLDVACPVKTRRQMMKDEEKNSVKLQSIRTLQG